MQAASSVSCKLGSVNLPKDRVGKLIGPQGSTINKIRANTGVQHVLPLYLLLYLYERRSH